MNTIFKIIYLPISFCIATICFLFALIFEDNFKEKNGESAFRRIERESKNLALMNLWKEIPDLGRAIIAIVIYYFIF